MPIKCVIKPNKRSVVVNVFVGIWIPIDHWLVGWLLVFIVEVGICRDCRPSKNFNQFRSFNLIRKYILLKVCKKVIHFVFGYGWRKRNKRLESIKVTLWRILFITQLSCFEMDFTLTNAINSKNNQRLKLMSFWFPRSDLYMK